MFTPSTRVQSRRAWHDLHVYITITMYIATLCSGSLAFGTLCIYAYPFN